MKFLIYTIISLFLLLPSALAVPFLHSYYPENNSFIPGGIQTFSVNVTDDNLNTSEVVLHIISLNAYEQGESWDTHFLTCTGTGTEFKCSKSISFAIAGSDTVELFYFEANDTDGLTGRIGTITNPLRFTLDRNPPEITFNIPTNNSYVSGNQTIFLTVTDSSSGVNNNSVEFSTDELTWQQLQNTSLTDFTAIWDTKNFQNNQTVTLYVRASDNVGNEGTQKINVTVDNEIPSLIITSSLVGNLTGNVELQVNVSDTISGIENVLYTVDSLSGSLGCTGTNYSAVCSTLLDTTQLSDGNHTLTLSVTDKAGNTNSTSLNISTRNLLPSISITEPPNNAFISGTTLIKASLTNSEGVTSVEIYIEQDTTRITTATMSCDASFTSCNYSLNTSSFSDGRYTIIANATNNLNRNIFSSIAVTIDNTFPTLEITEPVNSVSGDFTIKANVVDSNLNTTSVLFTISSFNGTLACTPETPSKYICSTSFNSRQLSDGVYVLKLSAQDKAGNLVTKSKNITISNQPSTITEDKETNETSEAVETPLEETKETEEGKGFGINLPFKADYIMVGIVVVAIVVIIAVIVIVLKQRLGKSIITEEQI